MKIFIDTEFNSFGGELISIALVAEDGNYIYEVLDTAQLMIFDDWVETHVVPYLLFKKDDHPKITKYSTKAEVRRAIERFLIQYDDVEIIADWPDDIRFLCELMITGPGTMIYTKQKIKFTIDRELDSISELPHNAYFDALGNMKSYKERNNV